MKFPKDIPKKKVLKVLSNFGFRVIREGNHIAMLRENPDGSKTPLTLPNHKRIKGSTMRHICTQAGIDRKKFLEVYEEV